MYHCTTVISIFVLRVRALDPRHIEYIMMMIIGQVSDIVKYFSDDSSIFVFSFIALFTNASHDWNGVEQGCHFAKVYDEQMLYDFDASSSCTRINPDIMKAIAHLLSNKLYLGVSVD